jgi:hypothetical protein
VVHYLWRRQVREGDEDDWVEEFHQLVAITQVAVIPPEEPEPEGSSPYFTETNRRSQMTGGQVWSDKPWNDLFCRFISHGCNAKVLLLQRSPLLSSICLPA